MSGWIKNTFHETNRHQYPFTIPRLFQENSPPTLFLFNHDAAFGQISHLHQRASTTQRAVLRPTQHTKFSKKSAGRVAAGGCRFPSPTARQHHSPGDVRTYRRGETGGGLSGASPASADGARSQRDRLETLAVSDTERTHTQVVLIYATLQSVSHGRVESQSKAHTSEHCYYCNY